MPFIKLFIVHTFRIKASSLIWQGPTQKVCFCWNFKSLQRNCVRPYQCRLSPPRLHENIDFTEGFLGYKEIVQMYRMGFTLSQAKCVLLQS